jgi:hypothetical protein
MRLRLLLVAPLLAVPAPSAAQGIPAAVTPAARDSVRPITGPATPLPPEAATAGITRFSFIAYGDTRGRFDGEVLQYEHLLLVRSMLANIAARAKGPDPIRFVTWSGDAVVNGREAKQWNVSFVDVVQRLVTQGNVPYFPAAGNHDVTSTLDVNDATRRVGLNHFLEAFGGMVPREGSPRRLDGYPTYAVGYGNTFILAIDSNIGGDSVQLAWVRRQLEGLDRARYRHVAVILHHPAYSSGPHGGANLEPQSLALRTLYMPLFRRHGVALMLAGHEHFFEHFAESWRGPNGERRRLDQVVSGGGGAPQYAYRGEPNLADYLRQGAADSVRVDHLVRPAMNPWENPYHYLIVHVDGDRLSVEVVGVDGGAGWQPYRSNRIGLGP